MGSYKEPWEYWGDYCEEEEKYKRKLPICVKCGNRITDEYLYNIDGDLYCDDCGSDLFKKRTENYLIDA